VLHDGKVAEIGSHEDLMNRKGYYYDIYKKQEMKGVEL
jgi:ATP-binding cassette subfamily B protein